MACSGAYATAADFQHVFCADVDLTDVEQVAQINAALALSAGDISAALAASGQCSCAEAAWAAAYLAHLNVIIAAVVQRCACGAQLSEETRMNLQIWIDNQLTLLRTSKLSICEGDTGAEFPAFGIAEIAWTDWNAAVIVSNQSKRSL